MQGYVKALAACGIIAVALTACSGSTSTPPVPGEQTLSGASEQHALIEDGQVVSGAHVQTPHIVVGTGLTEQTAAATNNLLYHKGKVMTYPAIGLVYWGFGTAGDPTTKYRA